MSIIVGNRSTGLTPADLVATFAGVNDLIAKERPVLVELGDAVVRVTQVRVEHGGVVVLHLDRGAS